MANKNPTLEVGHATKEPEGELLAARSKQVQELFRQTVEKYLPSSGALHPWKLAEIEIQLHQDLDLLAKALLEARLALDPLATDRSRLRCPHCDRALGGVGFERTHKKTVFGVIAYRRTYGVCPACGGAFSPSGQGVGRRHGLL